MTVSFKMQRIGGRACSDFLPMRVGLSQNDVQARSDAMPVVGKAKRLP